MKEGRIQECIDYIRFSMDIEGASLSEELETVLREILEEDRTVGSVIEDFRKRENLVSVPVDGADVMSNYPETRCLVNTFGIKDKTRLRYVEHFFVAVRTAEMFLSPIEMPFTFGGLKAVHEKLFSDIYPSAGMIRTKEASKRKDFCLPDRIQSFSHEIFSRLESQDYLKKASDVDELANDLAFYMGEIEALHPFRDGNGRAMRFFINRLVNEAGFMFSWAQADSDRMLEASIAAIDGDYQGLVDVLEEILWVRE